MSDESMTRLDRVDPLPLMRELIQRGEGDSAGMTLLRLQWLRREQPAARVETEVVPIDDRLIALRARIAVPDGWSVSAHAAVELADNPAAIEQAELRALSRALDVAGYALTEAPAAAQETRREEPASPPPPPEPAPAPMPRESIARPVNRPAVVDALRKMPARPEPAPAAEAAPAARPQRGDFTVVHDRRAAAPAPVERQPAPAASDEDDEAPVEDYSWTAFWRWAKGQGLNSPAEIAEVIGQPVGRLTPGELRVLLREHGVEG